MLDRVDTKIFGAYDITDTLVRMYGDVHRYQRFLDKPVLLKGIIQKLAVDINGYKKGLSYMLNNCDESTLERFEKTMKRRHPRFNINRLINELVPEREKIMEENGKMERVSEIKTFDVEEYTIGAREGVERIVFTDKEQMREAKQELEDGQDIEVRVKGEQGKHLVITVSHKMIRNKLYIGEIQLCARGKPKERGE